MSESSPSTAPELLVLVILTTVALALSILEYWSGGAITRDLLNSAADQQFKFWGLLKTLTVLLLFMVWVYAIAWDRTLGIGSTTNRPTGREFVFLFIQRFLPDLLLKSAIFAVAIWWNKPQLIGPFLIAFIADYIMQGRVFRLPHRASLALGVLTYLLCFYMIAKEHPSVLPALVAFSLAATLSGPLAWLGLRKKA